MESSEVRTRKRDRKSSSRVGDQSREPEEGRGRDAAKAPCGAVMWPPLPTWELLIYASVVVVVYSYATYQLYLESEAFRKRTLTGYGLLQPGWGILGQKYQDNMPGEWIHWKYFTLHPVSLAIYAGHVTGSYLTSRFFPGLRKPFLVCSSIFGTLLIVTPPVFFLILLHALLAYGVVTLGHRVWLLWLVVMVQLAMAVLSPFSHWQLSYLPENQEAIVKFIICIAFCCLRFIGFGTAYLAGLDKNEKLEMDGRESESQEVWTIFDYLLYVFYLPTVAHGPYTPPEVFFRHIKQAYYPQTEREVGWVCLQWMRPLLSAMLMEFLHHFLYVSAFMALPPLLEKMPLLTLIALAEWCVIVFQVQYMVYYGFARALAIFDGVLIPELPACVQVLHRAQDSWRYFDRGEHQFILRNIYIACGGSAHGSLRQFLALLASFCFTCYWHGGHYNVMGMVGAFWVLLQFEVFAPVVAKKLGITKVVRQWSPMTQRRLHGVMNGMKYFILVWALVMFINTLEIGQIYVQRLAGQVEGLPVLFLVHYCHLQLVEECLVRYGTKYVMCKHYMEPPS